MPVLGEGLRKGTQVKTPMSEGDIAVVLLEASTDALEQRFLASLGPETRNVLMETVRMRNEFLSDVSRMLTSGPESQMYAVSVRSSAVEVAYRWRVYRTMLQRYAELEMPSFVRIEVPSE